MLNLVLCLVLYTSFAFYCISAVLRDRCWFCCSVMTATVINEHYYVVKVLFTTQSLLYYQAEYNDVINYITTTSPLTKLSCTSLLSDSWTGSPVRCDSSHAVATADTFSASDFETEIFSLPDTQTSSTQCWHGWRNSTTWVLHTCKPTAVVVVFSTNTRPAAYAEFLLGGGQLGVGSNLSSIHLCCRKYWCFFNQFYVIRPESYRIRWN